MKKVDLDLEYDRFVEDNRERLVDKFLDIHDFNSYIEDAWKEYQDENGLVDKSNEFEENNFWLCRSCQNSFKKHELNNGQCEGCELQDRE